jgi:tetratricopeptide (TPR) repeat protein
MRTERQIHSDALVALAALLRTSMGDQNSNRREKFARKMLEIDPTTELAYRLLMELQSSRGERGLALRTYEECIRVLRLELGVEPEPATRDLAGALGFTSLAQDNATPRAPADSSRVLAEEILRVRANAGVPRVLLFEPCLVVRDEIVSRIARALVEDVIAGLSRCRSFEVIAPHTSLKLSSSRTARDLANLNARYAVNSVVKPGSRGLALAFRLSDCPTGSVVWSAELNFDLDQLPLLFGHLSHQIMRSLADAIEQSELGLPIIATSASAYRLFLEGRAALTGSDLPHLRKARNWFRKSTQQNNLFAPAFAGIARTLSMERLVRGLTDDTMLREALSFAERAAELDPFDGRGMRERGFSCLYLKRHDESLESFQRATELNPSDADLFADYADALAHSGQPKEGLKKCLRAMELNPLCPDYYHWILGSIYFQVEEYAKALEALQPVEDHPETARLLAASSALAGNSADAKHYAAIMRENYPEFRPEDLSKIVPDRFARDTQHLLEGLRLAGVE